MIMNIIIEFLLFSYKIKYFLIFILYIFIQMILYTI